MSLTLKQTIIGGVVIAFASKMIDYAAESLPASLEWLGNAGSLVWRVLSFSVQVPFVLVMALVLIAMIFTTRKLRELSDELTKTTAALKATEVSARVEMDALTPDEVQILQGLANSAPPMLLEDLHRLCGGTVIRFTYALKMLRSKEMIKTNDNETVWFTDKGHRYIVEHDLDKH